MLSSTRIPVDVLAALATHLWMRTYEPESIRKTLLALVLIPLPLIRVFHINTGGLFIAETYITFIVALLSSIVLYRVSPFHPLASCPGPLFNKITRFPLAYQSYGGKNHEYYKRLHDRYGRVVRTGPNEISVNDYFYVPDVLGNNGLPKGPLWEARRITPAKNRNDDNYLIGVRSLHRHAQLRKPWNRAFGAGPMKDYEAIMLRRATQLTDYLEDACSSSTTEVDMARWISFFAFDVMGDMVLGAGFELMRDGDKDGLWKGMEVAQVFPWVVGQIPWLAKILAAIPGVGKGTRAFGMFCVSNAQRRFNNDVDKDLFQHLLNSIRMDSATDDAYALIMPNVVTATIAGADTTASVLSGIIYYLLRYPSYLKRLTNEVDEAFPQSGGPLDTTKLTAMKLLNAIINETLRLQPAVPTAIQRAPLKGGGGRVIGDLYISEGTAVTVAPYCLHRNPTHFSPRTEEFWPERWFGAADPVNAGVADFALDTSAFIPFSYGPAGCVGKPMAMLELRYMVAVLVRKFDMAFPSAYNPDEWNMGLKDRFSMLKGALPVEITLRRS